jgi:hypothetical protein
MAGEVARAEATLREGLRFAERVGARLSLRWVRGNLVECMFHLGLWDEALELAEGEIDDPEPHYQQSMCRMVRAHVRLARGDERGALEDAELAARDARAIRDPQALMPALALRAFSIASSDDATAASAALAELADARRVLAEPEPAGPWVVWRAFALLELGRESELSRDELGMPTPWRDAALAIGHGDLVSAADILRAIGSVAFEAHVRLEAARRLTAEGRRAEAAAQLSGALSFYRGVGAARAVREGEALLAAAS